MACCFSRETSEGNDSDESQSLPPYPEGFQPMHNASPEFFLTPTYRSSSRKPKQRVINKRITQESIPLNNSTCRQLRSIETLRSKTQMHMQMNEVSKLVITSKKIVIIAGAGISVAAGIQDFRSSTGAYAVYNKDLFRNSVYSAGGNDLEPYLNMVVNLWNRCQTASPTKFHDLSSKLAREGNLIRMYTQNFDGLELKDDLLGQKTIQLHGDINTAICSRCNTEFRLQPQMFQNIENLATCSACPLQAKEKATRSGYNLRQNMAGVLKPKLVLFGDPLFDQTTVDETIKQDIRNKPDVLIIAGTSMNSSVQGIRDLFNNLRKQGCITIWVNTLAPPQQIIADIDFQSSCTADSFAESLSEWAAANIWEITKWNLEICYPPFISFTTNRGWGDNKIQTDHEIPEADMLQWDEDAVLQFWEEQGGRDHAIRKEYERIGEPAHSIIPRIIFKVLEENTDSKEYKQKEKAYKVKWQGYPGSDWVPEKYVQAFGPAKLKEYLRNQEQIGSNIDV